MRKLITVILLTLFASVAYADKWCEWSGTEGENCKNDRNGVLDLPFPTRTEALINSKGFYRVTITQPTVGVDQVTDAEIWSFVDNQIGLTWSVRDMTDSEIDNRIASPMSISDYYVWKTLLATEVITITQAQNNLPAELIQAYQARKRLLGD